MGRRPIPVVQEPSPPFMGGGPIFVGGGDGGEGGDEQRARAEHSNSQPDSATEAMAPNPSTHAPSKTTVSYLRLSTFRPPMPSPVFTGRAKDFEHINTFFHQNLASELAVRGIAGSGKTQLALQFAQSATSYSDVLYVNTASARDLTDLFQGLISGDAEAILATIIRNQNTQSELEAELPVAPSPSNESPRVGLIIFDGLAPPGLTIGPPGFSLRTTIQRAFGFQSLSIIYLLNDYPTMDMPWLPTYSLSPDLGADDAACLLIKSACPQSQGFSAEDIRAASEITEHFSHFPPAILQAGSAIRGTGSDPQAYRVMTSAQQQEWVEKIGTSSDSPWQLCYEMLSKYAQSLLRILAFLPPCGSDLLMEILIRARTNIGSYQSWILASEDMEPIITETQEVLLLLTCETRGSILCSPIFSSAVDELRGCFLFSTDSHNQVLRPGAYGWAKTLAVNRPLAEASAACLLAASVGPETDSGSECRIFRTHLKPLVDNTLLLYPDACATHCPRLSLVYETCGQWRKAIDLQTLVQEKCQIHRGYSHPDTALVTTRLAKTFVKVGRWKDGKRLQSKLLHHQEETLGEENLDTLSTMCDLAVTLFHLGRFEDAENLQKRVCDGRARALGEAHRDTLSAMHMLALYYSELGRWQEAQELHEQVLRARRNVLGEQHADTLSSMHTLATKHREAGQSVQEAEEANKQVLEARKEALGPEHPDTLSSMYALALVYRRQGQWTMAAELAANVLKMQRELFGRDHIDTIQTMQSLASWYSGQGGLSDAAALQAEILESRREVYGDDSPETLLSMEELVLMYWKQGLWIQAESLHLKLLEARKRAFGENDPTFGSTLLHLASRYLDQCRWREASVLFKEALEVKRQDPDVDENDPEIVNIQQQIDLARLALSLDVFIISPAVPMESVVAHFAGRAGLQDYSTPLQELPKLPTTPIDGGGFSNIYKILLHDGRELAVKCLKNTHSEYKQVKQTIRELNTWSQLRHESIAPLLGLALFQGQLAMVSTWNQNGNVMKYIERQPNVDRYALCKQVVSAVLYLHKSDVVHGDLKGANILVSANGTLQLTDFGLTIMHDATIQFSKSTNQASGGTLRWMAPELVFGNEAGQDGGQASGTTSKTLTLTKEDEEKNEPQPKLCKETDIYALGMTMLEIITGKRPFKELEKDAAVILALSKGKRPHRPKKVLDQSSRGAPFWDILQRCWAQAPTDRPTANRVYALMFLLGSD